MLNFFFPHWILLFFITFLLEENLKNDIIVTKMKTLPASYDNIVLIQVNHKVNV